MAFHGGKNKGGAAAAYQRAKWVGEGADTWLMVPFKGTQTGGGRDGLVNNVACGTERHRRGQPTEGRRDNWGGSEWRARAVRHGGVSWSGGGVVQMLFVRAEMQ
jgi:hypothetical protein